MHRFARTKTFHQSAIDTFMRAAKQNLPEEPTLPDAVVRQLRAKLILEEALETIEALGFGIGVEVGDHAITMRNVRFYATSVGNLLKIADGCADLSVVTIGTLSACGICDHDLLMEVDRNNLNKFGPGHTIREDGKLVKPPGHKPPNILEVLRTQGYSG
jgi:predicted HAD superfamily Cof-like phosphohydrolase